MTSTFSPVSLLCHILRWQPTFWLALFYKSEHQKHVNHKGTCWSTGDAKIQKCLADRAAVEITVKRLSYCDRGKENRNFRLPFSIINMFHICPKDLDIRDEVEKSHSNQTAFHLWSCMIEHKQRMKFTCFGFLFDVFHLHLHSLFSPCVIFYLLFYLFCPCDRFSSSHL